MGRYIDLDKCGQYRTNHCGYPDTFAFPPWAEFEDVAPVIHAHWIKHGEPPWYVIECSECGAKWQTGGSWDANDFCGNCGAKMDEEV